MTQLDSTLYKTDGESRDVCPTCGGHAETKAQTDATGHSYTLECRTCSWSVPLTRPPEPTHDDAVLMTDGGTTTADTTECGPQSAQDILDELHTDDSVARVAKAIATGDRCSADDVLRTLALAEDRLCLTVEFRTGVEYVWLADGWDRLVAKKARPNGDVLGPIELTADDLEYRLEKPIDIELVGSTPVTRPDGGAE